MSDYEVVFIALMYLIILPIGVGYIGEVFSTDIEQSVSSGETTNFFISFLQNSFIFSGLGDFLSDISSGFDILPFWINFILIFSWVIILALIIIKHLPTT